MVTYRSVRRGPGGAVLGSMGPRLGEAVPEGEVLPGACGGRECAGGLWIPREEVEAAVADDLMERRTI